jgi:hypothetical protein
VLLVGFIIVKILRVLRIFPPSIFPTLTLLFPPLSGRIHYSKIHSVCRWYSSYHQLATGGVVAIFRVQSIGFPVKLISSGARWVVYCDVRFLFGGWIFIWVPLHIFGWIFSILPPFLWVVCWGCYGILQSFLCWRSWFDQVHLYALMMSIQIHSSICPIFPGFPG